MALNQSRRGFLKTSSAAVVGTGFFGASPRSLAAGFLGPNERPNLGYIGAGIRYQRLVQDASPFGPCVAICDVDASQLQKAATHLEAVYSNKGLSAAQPSLCEDYRRILDRSDIDAVVIATPDHWHAKIAIEAIRAGKDVYCEKPLTLTIAEGNQILSALRDTGPVMQVGTQQRSVRQFQTAVAMLRDDRIGKVHRVTCAIGQSPTCDPLPAASPPSELNWNRWLGPAPWVEYREASALPSGGYGSSHPYSRAHAHFRWWYDYAGGKLTDWGAHHVDIAMWALDKSDDQVGKMIIDPIEVNHPVEFVDGYATTNDRFDVATSFKVRISFEDGVELDIVDDAGDLNFDNGIMFQGEGGRYFVNRGKLTGTPSEELAMKPLADADYATLYPGLSSHEAHEESPETMTHFHNFMECIKSRDAPISDVASHHRHLSVCHASNIAMRLGRKLVYDSATEKFVDDDQANTFLARESRKGFEIEG